MRKGVKEKEGRRIMSCRCKGGKDKGKYWRKWRLQKEWIEREMRRREGWLKWKQNHIKHGKEGKKAQNKRK